MKKILLMSSVIVLLLTAATKTNAQLWHVDVGIHGTVISSDYEATFGRPHSSMIGEGLDVGPVWKIAASIWLKASVGYTLMNPLRDTTYLRHSLSGKVFAMLDISEMVGFEYGYPKFYIVGGFAYDNILRTETRTRGNGFGGDLGGAFRINAFTFSATAGWRTNRYGNSMVVYRAGVTVAIGQPSFWHGK